MVLEATQARLLRAANSKRQLEEVLVDFWFNHFNVSAQKGRTRWMVRAYERDAIRLHVFGRFRDLLGATSKHPAMLFYLDNSSRTILLKPWSTGWPQSSFGPTAIFGPPIGRSSPRQECGPTPSTRRRPRQVAGLLIGCLAAFAQDLGEALENVCLVTMTEFGRTARENGTRGTDHGTASALFVFGGKVNGGKVYGRWPGLASLHEDRDLKATTDIRQVLAEILGVHLGLPDPAGAFPGFNWNSSQKSLFG